MIVATAVCPHPPLLLRELTGSRDAAADLRAACEKAVAELLAADPDTVVVVGGADTSAENVRGRVPVRSFGGTGERVPPREALPLSLAVARRLLDSAGCRAPVEMTAVAWDAGAEETAALGRRIAARPGRVALLVMGDGGACRGEKAPGHLDERTFEVDGAVRTALETGDPAALTGLDPDLAAELLIAGRAAFQVMAHAAGPGQRARLLYDDDPFGVLYLVALWRPGHTPEA